MRNNKNRSGRQAGTWRVELATERAAEAMVGLVQKWEILSYWFIKEGRVKDVWWFLRCEVVEWIRLWIIAR